jgi:NhaA family Na+:H+ antiporter
VSRARTSSTWRAAVPRLSDFAVEHLLLLPLGAALALAWVNVEPESYYRFTYAIAFAVNDVAMVLFFALVTKEVVEATTPGGVLHPWRRTLMPMVASIGATLVPAAIYGVVVDVLGEPMLSLAWPVTFATDIAVTYFVARVVFGPHPMVPFLLLLAIASNVLGFLTVALFNPTPDLHLFEGGLIVAAAVAVAIGLRRARVRSFWPYFAVAGTLSWLGFYRGGLHPALALIPIMPFLPHAARDIGFFVDAPPTARDALSQFELWFRYPSQIALLFFGLVNAGVPFSALEPGTWGLPIAVIIGKPLGILLAVAVAAGAGLHLPQRAGWRDLVVAGFIAAIGFSFGLFFSSALLAAGQLRSETSMGVLLTLAGALPAFAAAKLLSVGRFAAD